MEIQLKIIGSFLIALSLVHFIFPKYFNWEKDLRPLSLINREMMYVHTFFIALVVFLMGALCIISSHEIVTTDLGRNLALGFGIFWGIRLYIQFFGYSSTLWKGKMFETAVHVVFSIFWTYLSIVFFMIYFRFPN